MSPSSSEYQSQPRDSFAWLTTVVVQFPLNQHMTICRHPRFQLNFPKTAKTANQNTWRSWPTDRLGLNP